MATDKSFVATGPADVGLLVNGDIKTGVEASGAFAAGSFHLPTSTLRTASAVSADNPLCVARLCAFNLPRLGQPLAGIGVIGQCEKGFGIFGETDSGTAVFAQSGSGDAVFAASATGRGVFSESSGGHGIQGQSESDAHAGVSANNLGKGFGVLATSQGTTASGFIAGRSPFAGEETGVFGQAPERGVIGIASAAGGIGVYGGSVGGSGTGVFGDAGDQNAGVVGRSSGPSGVGVRGENPGGGLAGEFRGDIQVDGRILGRGGDLEQRISQLEQLVQTLLARLDGQQPVIFKNRGSPTLTPPQFFGNQIRITGDSFGNNRPVTLRVTDRRSFFQEFGPFNADGNGHVEIFVPPPAGFNLGDLFWAATDGRSDPHDLTGKLWSETTAI